MGGGNISQASQNQAAGPVLQRYSNKRIMHCSLCGQATHRKTNCPTKTVTPDEETELRNVEQGSSRQSNKEPNENAGQKKKICKEIGRQKLTVKRRVKNVVNQGDIGGQEEPIVNQTDEAPVFTQSSEVHTNPVVRKKTPPKDPAEKSTFLSTKESQQLEENLRGEVGYHAIFMPTPGLLPYRPPRTASSEKIDEEHGTPPAADMSKVRKKKAEQKRVGRI